MNIHDTLIEDHAVIRRLAADLRGDDFQNLDTLPQRLAAFQKTVLKHFAREDLYYRIVDQGKRFADRGLIHNLRNDHAGVVFTLESLAIRLRKNGVTPEWRAKFTGMMDVLLPHLDHEEASLFPEGSSRLSPDELVTLREQLSAL